jgi:hypothetical protein
MKLLCTPDVTERAARAMRRILASIETELKPDSAPWAADRDALAMATAAGAARRFSEAFDRWRQLYQGARVQLIEANRKSETHGISASERKDAKIQQAQANEPIREMAATPCCVEDAMKASRPVDSDHDRTSIQGAPASTLPMIRAAS